MTEDNSLLDRPIRLKRLRMRAWRRGMKEMDIILGGFVDREGKDLADIEMSSLETLINRQDQQLFRWASGGMAPPPDATDAEIAIMERITENFRATKDIQ